MVLSALKDNTSIETFSVKLSESSLTADNDNVVFSDRYGELCNALEIGIGKNKSIKTFELINLRLNNKLIDSIGKGLRENNCIRSLDISGNLIVKLHIDNRIGLDCQ